MILCWVLHFVVTLQHGSTRCKVLRVPTWYQASDMYELYTCLHVVQGV